jgi:hypothetical protein
MLMLIGDFESWAVFDLRSALLSRVSKYLLEGRSGESWGGLCFLFGFPALATVITQSLDVQREMPRKWLSNGFDGQRFLESLDFGTLNAHGTAHLDVGQAASLEEVLDGSNTDTQFACGFGFCD